MTSTVILLRLVHVMAAVLGAGTTASVAVAARGVRLRAEHAEVDVTQTTLFGLLRWATAGMAITLLSGIAFDFLSLGMLHGHWWFRLSGLSAIAVGVLFGRTRRALHRAAVQKGSARQELATVTAMAYASTVLVAWIVVLMELRPFG